MEIRYLGMRSITPSEFRARVRLANWHQAQPRQVWTRSIPDLQFIVVRSGQFRYQDAQGTTEVAPNQVLCIEPGIEHSFAHVDDGVGRIGGVHLELSGGRWVDGEYRCDPTPARVTQADVGIVEQFRRCAEVFEGYHRHRAALVDALATALIVDLAGAWTGAGDGEGMSTRMRAMLAHIREHAVRGCDRHDLARAFDLTPEHVNACFRRELDTTPGEVLHRERCRIAYRLLHEQGATVAEAAGAAGYEDPFHFSRVFHRLYGMAPSRVR